MTASAERHAGVDVAPRTISYIDLLSATTRKDRMKLSFAFLVAGIVGGLLSGADNAATTADQVWLGTWRRLTVVRSCPRFDHNRTTLEFADAPANVLGVSRPLPATTLWASPGVEILKQHTNWLTALGRK